MNNTTTVTISGQLNAQDWLDINRTVVKHAYGKQQCKVLLRLVGLFFLASAYFGYDWFQYYQTYAYYFEDHSSLPSFVKHMLVPLILLGVVIGSVIKIKKYPKTITKFALNNPENKAFLTPSTITFSDQGIVTEKQYTYGNVQWPAVVKVLNTPLFVMIFLSSTNGYFIKKTDCNEEELQTMLLLIQKHCEHKIILAD